MNYFPPEMFDDVTLAPPAVPNMSAHAHLFIPFLPHS